MRWLYRRIRHALGWHYVPAGGWKCLWCEAHRPVQSEQEWGELFDKATEGKS